MLPGVVQGASRSIPSKCSIARWHSRPAERGWLQARYLRDPARREDDVSLPPHNLGRNDREPINLALQIVPLDQDIFALHISEVAQGLNERDISIGGGNCAEQRQPR